MSESHITDFFDLVDHPKKDDMFCLRIKNIEKFNDFVVRFDKLSFHEDGQDNEEDDGVEMVASYDIVELPNGVDETTLTPDDKDFFEKLLSDILIYLLTIELDRRENSGKDDIEEFVDE